MTSTCSRTVVRRWAGLLAAASVALPAAGCSSPYSKIAKIGVKVVGDAVQEVDVSEHGKKLLGQPVAAADAMFGSRVRTLEDTRTGREMMTYPVQGDVLSRFRWVVEAENGRIVAVAKLRNDPDGGKDIVKKALLKEMLIGKTADEIQAHHHFRKLILVLRDRPSAKLSRGAGEPAGQRRPKPSQG